MDIAISFNQTQRYVCFGTSIGFYIYSLSPFKKLISRKIDGGISLIRMMNESNILLFVGRTLTGMYPRNKLIIWDDDKKRVLGEMSYLSPIVNIDVQCEYIVVATDRTLYLYDFESLTLLRRVDTPYNPKGLFSMDQEEKRMLVFPGESKGSLMVCRMDDQTTRLETIIAHESPIDMMYLSGNGKYVVTASEKGTLIRIFDTLTLTQVNEFRRGTDPCHIVDLRMNTDCSILLVASEKGTIHLFNTDLNLHLSVPNSEFRSLYYVKHWLPRYFQGKWSFAQIHLKGILTQSIFDFDSFRIHTIGHDGQYYLIDLQEELTQPRIERTIRFVSDELDPFNERVNTIR